MGGGVEGVGQTLKEVTTPLDKIVDVKEKISIFTQNHTYFLKTSTLGLGSIVSRFSMTKVLSKINALRKA